MKELLAIQQELNCPKSQRNNFGNYNYRSCEDILTAVKPLLKKYKSFLMLTDHVINIGDRNYVRSTAIITNSEGQSMDVCGWAREPEGKKGMDPGQITGASSSYARKYALNGLFAIDDVRDADATNTHQGSPKTQEEDYIGF